MKILYFGSACDKEWFNTVSMKNKTPFSVAQYTFELALIKEILNCSDVDINYIYRDKYFPNNKLFFLDIGKCRKLLGTKVNLISFINIPFIKELCMMINGFIKTLYWGIANRNEKDKIIMLAIQYAPVAAGVKLASSILNLSRVIIITDVAKSTYDENKINTMPFYKKLIMGVYKKVVLKLEASYDGYILFSKPMNELVNIKNKPYIVMEGIFNPECINLEKKEKKNAIMHAGTLSKEVGVKSIIDVFRKLEDESLELWLFGDGNLKEYILEMEGVDNRIKYYGFRSRDEVFEYQKQATILINLRNPNDDYTKYSFPSKTFEYMVSGTPFVTTELECIPDEYKEYLIFIEEDIEDLDKIKIELESILRNKDNLNEIGINARKFILDNKNPKKQVSKIYEFLELIK